MPPRSLHRFSFISFAGLAFAIASPSCDGAGVTPGTGDSAGQAGSVTVMTGGSANQSGGAAVSGGASGSAATATGGSSAGTSSGAGGSGTAGSSSAPPCTDKQHPDHASMPCSTWPEWDQTKASGEAKDCDAPWLTGAGYCLESCGKCKSAGTGGSNSGTGGSNSGTGGSGNVSGGSGLGPGPSLPNLTSGDIYWASRYWDCCKTHCATNAGAKSCGKDGMSQDNGSSACSGGSGYACYSEAPRAIGDNVSYGHVAVPNPSCNTCYHIQFTGKGQDNASDPGSLRIANKHMIVRVSNTGGDVGGHQFDLMIPGGGVGQNDHTCTAQWGLSKDQLGAIHGGFVSYPNLCYTGTLDDRKKCVRAKCDLLPAGDARNGCYWWVDWLNLADNPQFRYEPIACPKDI